MNTRFYCRKLFIALAVACLAPFLSAQDGLKGALSQANFTSPLGHTLAVADLDGDSQADGAILIDSQRMGAHTSVQIKLHFTGRPNSELNFESSGHALAVRAWDVDQDGDNDLVVEDAFTHKPLRVWINEGHGDFHEGNVQDFPALALEADKQLQPPSNQPFGLLFCVAQQRGFEISILTVHLLGRPPSGNTLLAISTHSSATLQALASHFSRAPPLFS